MSALCQKRTIASVRRLDVIELPRAVERWFERAVQTEHRKPSLARDRLDPVVFKTSGAFGPK
jgi:hypothetical protein